MYINHLKLVRSLLLTITTLAGCSLAANEMPLVSQVKPSDQMSIFSPSAPSPDPTQKAADFAPVLSYSRIVVTLLPHPNFTATTSSDLDWHIAYKALVGTTSAGEIGNMAFKKKGTLPNSAILAAKLWRSVRDDSQAKLDQRCGCFSKGAIVSSGIAELKDGFIELPLDSAMKTAYASAGKEGSEATIGLLVKIDPKKVVDGATLGFDIQDDRRSFHAFAADADGIFEWPNMEYRGLPFEGPLITVTKGATKSVPISIGIS